MADPYSELLSLSEGNPLATVAMPALKNYVCGIETDTFRQGMLRDDEEAPLSKDSDGQEMHPEVPKDFEYRYLCYQ